MSRETIFFNDSYYISDDSYFGIQDLEKIREKFNQSFKKHNIDIIVDKDFTVNRFSVYEDLNYEYDQLDNETIANLNSDLLLNHFFFFPSHKLILLDNKKEQEIGMRMCFVKEGKHGLKVHVFDITNKQYQNISKWTTGEYFGKKLKVMERFEDMYPSYMKIFKQSAERLDKKHFIIYTTQSGWVQGGHRWFYVPVSPVDDYDLIYGEAMDSKYKMRPSKEWSLEEAFIQTWRMLDITDKRITLPLLSYTFLSLITSLMGYNEDDMPKFMICISGNNKALDRQGFANLFCNLYGRKPNIFSLNSMYHLKSDMDKKMLEKKSSKIRDGIFIINADTRPKIIERAIQGLQNYDLENMILVLNNKKLDKEFVLNLDISDLDVSSSHMEHLRNSPDILSACVFYVTENFREVFAHNETSSRKKIGIYLSKQYKHFRKLMERKGIPQEEDKLHMYSCLLVGLDILLNVVKNDRVVFDDKTRNNEVQAYMNEAIQIFQHECAIEDEVIDNENESRNGVLDEKNSEHGREEHLVFLEKLFELLPTPLPRFEEKSENPNILAWRDKKNENILWIKNDVFRFILLSLDNDFDALHKDDQKSMITKYKTRMYEQLRSVEVCVILPVDDKPENEEIMIKTTEKDDYTGRRRKDDNTRKSCVVFKIDLQKALEYLNTPNKSL
ncbi:hypothetical protein ACFOQM_11120 [Paenibacillus sp. GCM10012307]|uniref:Uncharacterized protein n=1 Tax=Paenibacillus roseus TaxID=2798579 RepID=A0A934J7I6_9BACL|nr:hypothetical protein [Paenibacillus roseus]MBJ6361837.1 hypothetical protein [Paenibacillus roseus]